MEVGESPSGIVKSSSQTPCHIRKFPGHPPWNGYSELDKQLPRVCGGWGQPGLFQAFSSSPIRSAQDRHDAFSRILLSSKGPRRLGQFWNFSSYLLEIKPVSPKGNQPWTFIGRIDAEAEALILWPPNVKSRLIGKDPDAGKDWGQEEKGTAEDEMVGWHHQHNGHEFEQTLGDSEGQGSVACCNPRVTESRTRLSNWKPTTWYPMPKYLIRRKEEWVSFVILFSRNIFRRQHSQEEHGRRQTSLANTNNNFTNPTNLLLSLAH